MTARDSRFNDKGPFAVLQRSEKFFKLDMNGIIDNVSIDRLKPAYLLNAYDLSTSDMNEFSTSASPHQHNAFQTNYSFFTITEKGENEETNFSSTQSKTDVNSHPPRQNTKWAHH